MKKYAYEDLSEAQFEQLVILLCQRLFGIAVQGFAKGPDGGRDAKFVGKAELFPSKAAPWEGTVIIQAKHTNGLNCSFSESDFYSPSSQATVLGEEIPRIKKLRDNHQVDHYILFANRKLAANAESMIREYLSAQCGLPIGSVSLCGIEQLELWLKRFSDVPKEADLDPIDSPLIISPDDLADVVQALAAQVRETASDDSPVPRISYERKNQLNNMTDEYAKAQRKNYLRETEQIRRFLAAPENIELLHKYMSVIDEFQLKIIAHRKDYQTFDKVLEYLLDLLFKRDPDLRRHKRLTRAMIFYMYWNCDIGKVDDAETK